MRVFHKQQCLGRKSFNFQGLIEKNIEQHSLNPKKF